MENKIKQIIADLTSLPLENVSIKSSLYSLGLDSLEKIELVLLLEEEFNITIDPTEFLSVITIEDLIKFIERRING